MSKEEAVERGQVSMAPVRFQMSCALRRRNQVTANRNGNALAVCETARPRRVAASHSKETRNGA
jgi:hypothetical protein